MTRPGSELASRFRAVVGALEARRQREEDDRRRRLEQGRAARDALLTDLLAFGEAIGHVVTARDAETGAVSLSFGERELVFEGVGDGDKVKITVTGASRDEHRLYREAELGHRWVWRFRRAGQEERMPLFDAGLEELMVGGLGLPRPDGSGDPVGAGAGSLDDLVPGQG